MGDMDWYWISKSYGQGGPPNWLGCLLLVVILGSGVLMALGIGKLLGPPTVHVYVYDEKAANH